MRSTARRQSPATLAFVITATLAASVLGENVVFPDNFFVKNVRTQFGAKGDGRTDDTGPLRNAFKDNQGIIYLPNGVYRVTGSIICNGMGIGPWVYGQSRDSVIIRLDDNAAGFQNPDSGQPVIAATSHLPGQGISADQFFRQWHNFTVDAGNNPGAIGIRYYGNNSSTLDNVKITGNGTFGLDMGWVAQNGPLLVHSVLIEGFRFGVYASGTINSQTMSDVTIRNCQATGVFCSGQNLSIEDLTVENTPIAVTAAGMLCLINATLGGSDATKTAINNTGRLYCRNVSTQGFARAILSGKDTVAGPTVAEYISEPVSSAFANALQGSLKLPIKKAPVDDWESNPAQWVDATDFGAAAGDGRDDGPALQAAIDAAAAQNQTTVCIEPSIGNEPNWYTLATKVYVHGSVRRIIGLGFARILGSGADHGIILRDDAAPVVRIDNLYAFGGTVRTYVNNTASTLVVENSDGFRLNVSGGGDVFVNNCCAVMAVSNSSAHVWARQWDTEGDSLDTDNDGVLWILGLKTERGGLKIRTTAGGCTELLGAHIYNTCTGPQFTPLFQITEASASFACVREVCYCSASNYYTVHVNETRAGVSQDWHAAPMAWALYSGADTAFHAAVRQPITGARRAPSTAKERGSAAVYNLRGERLSAAARHGCMLVIGEGRVRIEVAKRVAR